MTNFCSFVHSLLAAFLYPEKLTFSSSGYAATYQPDKLAEYEMMDSVCFRGRPVWKKASSDQRYLFYGTDDRWWIGQEYNAASSTGWIYSELNGLSEVPQNV